MNQALMMPDVTKSQGIIETGYVPRPLQRTLHEQLRRFNVLVMHRRFGKTIFSINTMIDRALRCPHPMPRFAYLAPTYGQAKRIVWDVLKNYTKNIPGVESNEADLRVDIPQNKARIMLLSAENPDSLKGIYLDGAILDEYASMNPTTWSEVIRPTLSDRRGWAAFIGTPKGQNNFYDLYQYAKHGKEGILDPDWFCSMYKASETGILSQEELESNKRTMSEDEYEQEFECSFTAALSGAYFGKELAKCESDGRIGSVPYDPALLVDTFWDLGINDTCSVWFVQSIRGRHRIIDYLEICGASIPDVVNDIKKRNYNMGEWVFPHDAKARDFSTGKTQAQIFYNLGCKPQRIIPRVGTKRESINAARMTFPLCDFDAKKCEKGLKALAQYQRKWNEKANTYDDAPLHNWASNGADAFQCFGLGVRPNTRDSSMNGKYYDGSYELSAEMEYNPYA